MAGHSSDLDEVDRELLYHLQGDARNTTNAKLGELVDVSATTIGQRISDLEEQGTIKAYEAVLDYEQAGFPHRILLICSVDPADLPEAADTVLQRHGVVSVRELITGTKNLHVEVVGHTRDEVVNSITVIENDGVSVEETELINRETREPFDEFKSGQPE